MYVCMIHICIIYLVSINYQVYCYYKCMIILYYKSNTFDKNVLHLKLFFEIRKYH